MCSSDLATAGFEALIDETNEHAEASEGFVWRHGIDARDLDTAEYVGHRSLKTVSELIAMGYSQEEIEENSGGGDVFSINYEAQTRNPALMTFTQHMDSADQSLRRIVYVESYIRIDRDGDGIAELRRLRTLEEENRKLKQLVADLSLDKKMLQDVLSKKL